MNNQQKRMCLGTSGRLARSLATTYIFARVRIIGTLVPFCVIGDSKEFPITQKKHASEIFTSNACLFQKQLLLYIFCIFTKARAVHLSLLYYFLFLRKSGILICVSWRIGRNGCAGADCGASFGATGCAGAAADGARKVGAL